MVRDTGKTRAVGMPNLICEPAPATLPRFSRCVPGPDSLASEWSVVPTALRPGASIMTLIPWRCLWQVTRSGLLTLRMSEWVLVCSFPCFPYMFPCQLSNHLSLALFTWETGPSHLAKGAIAQDCTHFPPSLTLITPRTIRIADYPLRQCFCRSRNTPFASSNKWRKSRGGIKRIASGNKRLRNLSLILVGGWEGPGCQFLCDEGVRWARFSHIANFSFGGRSASRRRDVAR
jgi:hypothetical protein